MQLKYVLTATNTNAMYCDFIEVFIKAWKALIPDIKVRIILIAKEIPQKFKQYKKHIILFPPLDGMNTAFQAQNIRLLYPSLLGANENEKKNEGVLITDMDMLPMNSSYYTGRITNFSNDRFISYRNVLQRFKELPMCYNLATPKVWEELFGVTTLDKLKNTLKEWYKPIKYDGRPGKAGWNTDQKKLYKRVQEWKSKTNRVTYLNDKQLGYRRMNPNARKVSLNPGQKKLIKEGHYSDYHMHRPYSTHKVHIDVIVKILESKN